MNGLDFAVAGILLVSLLLGLWRGLIHEVMALLGWPLAFVLSRLYAHDIARLLPLQQENTRIVLSYALVFIAVLILWAVLAALFSRLIRAAGSGWTDRLLGGMFGVLRGTLLVLVLVWMVGLTNFVEQSFWRDALTRKILEDAALLTKSLLPDSIAQRIRYGIRS